MSSSEIKPMITIHIPPQLHHLAIPLQRYLDQNPKYNCLGVQAYIFTPSPIPRVLLVQRSATETAFPNLWEGPGGGAEPSDPTILHSVAREVFEETGLHLTRFTRQVGNGVEFKGRRKEQWQKLSFVIEVAEIPPLDSHHQPAHENGDAEARDHIGITLDPAEHQAYKWATEEQIRECGTFPQDPNPPKERQTGGDILVFMTPSQLHLTLEAFAVYKESA